ncbi:MAG: hypothetical protein PHN56_00865 [Candidatus Nanoarchaeia archaeon]|nr:hypothetical protein [Candidatus Nanoarchaeia archaeon]
MNKAQTFGFDLLIIIIGIIFFSQLIYTSFFNFPKDYFFQRNIENHELLRAFLMQNNSLAYLNCYESITDNDCLKAFNDSVKASLSNYLDNREYLLEICGLRYYSNESFNSCFIKAIPYYLNLTLTNGNCEVYFSIYTNKEVSELC